MRFVFLGDGSLNHIRRWAGFFSQRGHDVLLISFEDVRGCPFPAVRLKRRLPTKLLGYLSALNEVRTIIADFAPDLVNALYVAGYGLIGVLSGRRPVVVSAIGSDLLIDYRKNPVHRLQIRHALRTADLVTTDAEVLTRIAASAGARRERIITMCFGIEEDIFYPAAQSVEPSQTRGAPRIVSTRSLHPVYNLDLLLDAAPMILRRIDAHFIIIGEGPERTRLEDKSSELGVEDNVTFTGRIATSELADELRSADVYVSTSLSDSTSVSLLEAMASGAPPVVTDLEANREWVVNGENGLLVPVDSPEGLAEAVVRMIEDRDFASRARERNFAVIEERGLWRSNMEAIEMAFVELAGISPPP